jgi:hypothetical protein
LYADTVAQWAKQGWRVKVWTRAQCEALVTSTKYARLYHKLERNVQRSDLIRLVIIWMHGGFYCDLDCIPTKGNLFDFVKSHDDTKAVYFIEHISTSTDLVAKLHPIRRGQPELAQRLANFLFGAEPRHDSVQAILDLVEKRCEENPQVVGDPDYYVLFTTGPSALTRALSDCKRNGFTILPHASWCTHLMTGSWRGGRDALLT